MLSKERLVKLIIDNYYVANPIIKNQYINKMKNTQITEEIAKEMYNSGSESLKQLAELNYPELFRKEKKWEDFGEVKGVYINIFGSTVNYNSSVSNNDNMNIHPTSAEARRALALIQLTQWRDKYNGEPLEDWCDWEDETQDKYCIVAFEKTYTSSFLTTYREVLTFKTESIRDQFMKDHKTLLDEAFNL